MPVGAAIAAIAVIALVGLGYLVGRGPSDARRTYLLVVSGASLLVLALGVITTLFGIVDVSLPGSVRARGGHAGMVARIHVGPGVADRGGAFQIPMPGRDEGVAPAPMMGRPDMVMTDRAGSSSAVRSAGLIKILRGIVLALVAGVIFRYHWSQASEAPPEPSPSPARRTRRADQ